MPEFLDSHVTTIDGLIEWLNEQRRNDAETPLVVLIGDRQLDRNVILDLACIDLMHQRRNGRSVRTEQYLQDFPQLNHANDVLDLIDAELCVATELKDTIDLEVYRLRFPELSSEIEDLMRVDLMPAMPLFHAESSSAVGNGWLGDSVPPDSARVTVDGNDDQLTGFVGDLSSLPANQPVADSRNPEEYPLNLPDWFVVDECVARDKDRWLLRGHDDVRGMSLAMKITRLHCSLTDPQVNQLLDVCEAASNVQNPHWVTPRMVAVQRGYLGVVRPWQFAKPWTPAQRQTPGGQTEDQKTNGERRNASHKPGRPEQHISIRWRRLAEVAFAVEAAHRSGATHGALHSGNLVIDHAGQVRILDAASSQVALKRWLEYRPTIFHDLDQRLQIDVDDVVRLIADETQREPSSQTASLLVEVRQCVSENPFAPLAVIGEVLMKYADSEDPMEPGIDHRSHWKQWFLRWMPDND